MSKIKRRKGRNIKQEKKISRQETLDNMEKQRMLSFLYKERITKMYNDGMSITEISKTLGVMTITPKTSEELYEKYKIE